ncbi:MAG: hypothetical protein MPJ50_10655 [Pirellulales bacterium]|nr:hypothetical protein [Pirellulales bacterium]
MKFSIDLGFRNESIEQIRSRVEAFMGATCEERCSDYRGGDYLVCRNAGEEVKIQLNRDGDELAEEEFPEHTVLVLFDPTTRDRDIEGAFLANDNCALIRKREYPRESV